MAGQSPLWWPVRPTLLITAGESLYSIRRHIRGEVNRR
jgi:hypothetical protein